MADMPLRSLGCSKRCTWKTRCVFFFLFFSWSLILDGHYPDLNRYACQPAPNTIRHEDSILPGYSLVLCTFPR